MAVATDLVAVAAGLAAGSKRVYYNGLGVFDIVSNAPKLFNVPHADILSETKALL